MWQLAWRNIWRNKRRTIITAASVLFAVFLSIIMIGFQKGAWVKLIDSVLHSYSGYVQIHANGYWNEKSLDYTLAENDSAVNAIKNIKNVKGLIPHLESFSLISSGNKTKGVITIGIDPEVENNFSALKNKLVSGRYIDRYDSGVILSRRLAEFLKLKVNDSIVLLSQGYHGANANGIFKIIGIVGLPSQEFDNRMVFMPLKVAQDFYSSPGLVTSYVVDLKNPQKMDLTIKKISSELDLNKYEVMSWEKMLIELYQARVSDEGGAIIMLLLLYIIVGFGVFGTVLMMFAERKREFGIMVTIGMKRKVLLKMVGMEMAFIGIIGLIAGFLLSIPIITYFHYNPIQLSADLAKAYEVYGMEPVLPVAWQTDYMFQQIINVALILVLTITYPLISVYKLNVSKVLKR